MKQISTIGLDLAKHVFQVHGVDEEGHVMVRMGLIAAAFGLTLVMRGGSCLTRSLNS